MGGHVLSIIVAFVAYTMLDVGKVFQKIGLAVMSARRGRGMAIWLAASTATSVSSLLILYAVSLGSVLVVASMAGTGLAAVTLLSAHLTRKQPRPIEIVAVACIMIAPFLMGSVYVEPPADAIVIEHMFASLAAVMAVLLVPTLFLRGRSEALGGLLALAAGALGGFMVLFQKLSTSVQGRAASLVGAGWAGGGGAGWADATPAWVPVLVNPYAALWIALSLLSTLVLQLSYRHGQAIRLIPLFNGAYILVPVLGAVFIMAERLHRLQLAGVLLILAGIACLAWGGRTAVTAGSLPSGAAGI
jgi:uncharacterized membrane protein